LPVHRRKRSSVPFVVDEFDDSRNSFCLNAKKELADRVSPRLRLRVTAAAESILRSGHPWLFAESVREQNRDGQLGELAVIYDRRDHFLAIGLFDPLSPIRVRILHAGAATTIDSRWWTTRLDQALDRREGWFDEHTTGFRWINGESDGWPGLVLDRYADTLALKLYTAAWFPRLNEISGPITKRLAGRLLVLRLSRNIRSLARDPFHFQDGQMLHGSKITGPIVFQESGLRFEADVLRGQKTGFFLDQRENRRLVETLSKDRDVLNAFSFSGGFSLYAARGGARSVTDLDLSAHALEAARRNFKLNEDFPQVIHCRHELIQADAFAWLGKSLLRKFDLVILDPPSLAKRESERAGAIRAYRKLAQSAIEHLRSGGILVAASCSAHVSAEEFFGAVREAARKSGRQFAELQTTGHPLDHPATFPEAQYLKCVYLRF